MHCTHNIIGQLNDNLIYFPLGARFIANVDVSDNKLTKFEDKIFKTLLSKTSILFNAVKSKCQRHYLLI